jgi:thiol-disulfide isomerase/thioredoxin
MSGEKMRAVLIALLIAGAAQAQEFNYGLWGKRETPAERPKAEKRERAKEPARREDFSWEDFLPPDVPRPMKKLLENPTPETARKYWKAYEEFAERLSRAGRQVRLLQLEYAKKVASRYRLYYFFSPTCPACRRYSPLLFGELLREGFEVPTKAFVVGDLSRGKVFASALGIADVKKATPYLLSQLEVSSLPTAVLFEGDRVVARWTGSSVLELVNFLKERRNEEIGEGGVNSAGGG